MVEPQGIAAGDRCDGDATRLTSGLNSAPADVEPSPRCPTPLKFDVVHIPVDDVLVIGPRRAVNDDMVTRTAESIERIGLQTPITLRILENVPHPETAEVLASAHVLVTGLHRLGISQARMAEHPRHRPRLQPARGRALGDRGEPHPLGADSGREG